MKLKNLAARPVKISFQNTIQNIEIEEEKRKYLNKEERGLL